MSKSPNNQDVGGKSRVRREGCGFCASNRAPAEFVRSHEIRDQDGKLSCPVLMHYTCPTCGQNGHTKNFCPVNRGNTNGWHAALSGIKNVKTNRRPALSRVDPNFERRDCANDPNPKNWYGTRKSFISPLERKKNIQAIGSRLERTTSEPGISPTPEISSKCETHYETKNLEVEPRFTKSQLMRAFWIGRVSMGHSLLLTAEYERKFSDKLYIETEFRLANAMIENLNLNQLGFNDLLNPTASTQTNLASKHEK